MKLKGEPAAELDDEGDVGYVVATALLKRADGNRRPMTPFEVKDVFWLDLLPLCSQEMGDDEPLFRYLTEGRPLFGRTNRSGLTYAWFDKDEAVPLREAAKRLVGSPQFADSARLQREAIWMLTDEHEGLAGCIDRILAEGYDVWAETK